MRVLRKIFPFVLLLAILGVIARVLIVIGGHAHWSPRHDVILTRMLAAAFLMSDVAIGVALITLLAMRDRRPPAWIERRFPASGQRVWGVLLAVVVLCYLSLAPTWLFLLIQMKKP